METAQLIKALSRPGAYPHHPDAVEIVQTHISVVALAGELVYKVRKPVDMGFLDFTTLEKRCADCHAEVELNRRLAPSVYLGVVPIAESGDGLLVEGSDEPIEWAVKMRRLPEDATLESRLAHDEISAAQIETLAERIAAFHRGAERGPHISEVACFETISRNLLENLHHPGAKEPEGTDAEILARLTTLTTQALEAARPLIEERSRCDVPCDCHGDLKTDHVYLFPDAAPPDDLVIIDCIEFNERFRYIDPVADMAFLAMDLTYQGRRDLSRALIARYFRSGGDEQGRALLQLYLSYRAAVRAKVLSIQAGEAETDAAAREALLEKARTYRLLSLGEIEAPGKRAGLVLIGGLPGTGKSTLAHAAAEAFGFELIRSDLVRKELAGLAPETPGTDALYSAEMSERTYKGCARRAGKILARGGRVIVDANFREEARRIPFVQLARECAARMLFAECRTPEQAIRRRLEKRGPDASDADWAVYRKLRDEWEPPAAQTARVAHSIDTGDSPEAALRALAGLLRAEGLLPEEQGP
ncbi:MAG: AAA family ATPase [Chrysiogenetes bacterium]|nr:AAA family ATPase [Chrysiogenetes bacterium]